MSAEDHALPIPQPAHSDSEAKEIVRVWVADNGLHCSMQVLQWKPHVWGIVLSDIVRHVAQAEFEAKGAERNETVRTIVDKFMDELHECGEELDTEGPSSDV